MAHLFYLKTLLTVKSRELVHNYIYKFTILPYYNKRHLTGPVKGEKNGTFSQ